MKAVEDKLEMKFTNLRTDLQGKQMHSEQGEREIEREGEGERQ